MKRFKLGQRVTVHRACRRAHDSEGVPLGMAGRVIRLLRRDDSAWIELDQIAPAEVRAFPVGDEHGRDRNVLAWPDWCEVSP
jgi:hypothetical protein